MSKKSLGASVGLLFLAIAVLVLSKPALLTEIITKPANIISSALNLSNSKGNLAQVVSAVNLPQLPQVYVDVSMPTQTGATINVANNCAGLPNCVTSFYSALSSAQPGDTIVLKAGDTFNGNFILLPKTNPNNKWIVIKSSNLSSLPPSGTRVSPANAPNMPKIEATGSGRAIWANPGSSYYRFIGVEVTDDGKPSQYGPAIPGGGQGGFNGGLINLGADSAATISTLPHHIIFDRSYIHGQPYTHIKYGINMSGAHLAVIDSYLSEFHGVGQDTQAINGYNGPGPLKITNNFLSAGTEIINFGGADPYIYGMITKDIEITKNYFFKPLSWNPSSPTYAGIYWQVKNIFELKQGQRILVDGNVMENNWSDAQNGYAFLIKAVNQGGGAPFITTTDITVTNNIIKSSPLAVNVCMICTGSQGGARFLIENNLFLDIDKDKWRGSWSSSACCDGLVQVLLGSDDLTFRHNTIFYSGTNSNFLVSDPAILNNRFVMTDNISAFGEYGISGISGLPGSVITKNVVVKSAIGPAGNFTQPSYSAIGFVNNNGALNGDYSLSASSPYKGKATDGTDIGVNWPAIAAATAGVVAGNPNGGSYVPPVYVPPPPPPADTTDPSVPTGLSKGTLTQTSVVLTWNASTDNVGVTGYKVYRNGILIGSPTATTYTDSGLVASTTYSFTVAAYDAAGNLSAKSAPLSVTTPAAPVPPVTGDTAPPSVPTGLNKSSLTDTSVIISWNASTDNVAVTGYKVYRNGALLASAPTTNYLDTGLTPSSSYTFTVSAYDAAGNTSLQSAALSVTTPATPTTPVPPVYVPPVVPGNPPAPYDPSNLPKGYLPVITLSVIPELINPGQSSILRWSTTDATSCVGDSSWGGSTTSGSAVVSPTRTTVYAITCTGPAGSTRASALITVTTNKVSPPPAVTIPSPVNPDLPIYTNPTNPGSGNTDGVKPITSPYLKLGDTISVVGDFMNVRAHPTIYSQISGKQYRGATARATAGPLSANGYIWWFFDFKTGADGWGVDSFVAKIGSKVFSKGSTVYTTDNVNIRSGAGVTATNKLGAQRAGARGVITDGPISPLGNTWWKVDFATGADGWVMASYLN